MYKTVLKSINIWKYTVTYLTCVVYQKNFDNDRKSYLLADFCVIWNFVTKHAKLFKIQGFFKISQNQGFSKFYFAYFVKFQVFRGKVVTL